MKVLLLAWTSLLISSFLITDEFLLKFPNETDEGIVVRESTVDLQVRVGEKLFVFGKAQGTLDKIKVGMHVLHFAQNPKIAGTQADFHQVTWKKLKDGSVQIQSSYKPWPAQLTWLVLPTGQLKMMASSSIHDSEGIKEMGLGFDVPEEELRKVSLDNRELDFQMQNGESSPFNTAKLEFDYVSLLIQSVANPLTLNSNFKEYNAEMPDLVFHRPAGILSVQPATPGTASKQSTSIKSVDNMILLFDFQ